MDGPSPATRDEVSRDLRVQKLVELLYSVDFGVNMDGWGRARVAQVIIEILDADRAEIATELRRGGDAAKRYESYGAYGGTVTVSLSEFESAVERVRSRYHLPDLTGRRLWAAGQPRKDWVK